MLFSLENQLAILEIFGDDANKFLQGQLTNDINSLNNDKSQLSAHLNNKGRIIANFIIFQYDSNSYYLLFPKNLLEIILPRLKMFVLRSKVTIQQSNKFAILNDEIHQDIPFYQLNKYTISLNNFNEHRMLGSISDSQWHNLLVENALPFIYQQTTQQIIPQQINLDLLNAINFKKGCYTGQEIVARTHYLGKVKRRLVKFTSNIEPKIGQTITSPTIDNQEIGFVIDYYQNSSTFIGLASIQLDYKDNAQIENSNIICKIIGVEHE